MNESSSVCVAPARTELATPAKSTPKPTSAIAAAASHVVREASVASARRTQQATASVAWLRSRSRIGPTKSTSSSMANEPKAAKVATVGVADHLGARARRAPA